MIVDVEDAAAVGAVEAVVAVGVLFAVQAPLN